MPKPAKAKVRWMRGAWWVVAHFGGVKKKLRIGADEHLAEEKAAAINRALARDEHETVAPTLAAFRDSIDSTRGSHNDSASEEAAPVTLAALAEEWLRKEIDLPRERGHEDAVAPKTAKLHEAHLRLRILPVLGDRPVAEIGIADVRKLYDACLEKGDLRTHEERRAEVLRRRVVSGGKRSHARKEEPPDYQPTPHTVDVTIRTLGRVLAFAEERELTTRNAVAAWKRARGRRRGSGVQPVERKKVLDSAELARFLDRAKADFPDSYPFVLFLADAGVRLGEATALRWIDVDLEARVARIRRSYSDGGHLSPTKTGRERVVELSSRLVAALAPLRPDVFGDESLVFPDEDGGFIDPQNFRARVFRKLVERELGKGRDFTPHGLRHTFASLHLARGTNLKWIQAMGGWASAKLLLDLYGHHLRTENAGYADVLSQAPNG